MRPGVGGRGRAVACWGSGRNARRASSAENQLVEDDEGVYDDQWYCGEGVSTLRIVGVRCLGGGGRLGGLTGELEQVERTSGKLIKIGPKANSLLVSVRMLAIRVMILALALVVSYVAPKPGDCGAEPHPTGKDPRC